MKSSGGDKMALPINGPARTNQNISLKKLHFYSYTPSLGNRWGQPERSTSLGTNTFFFRNSGSGDVSLWHQKGESGHAFCGGVGSLSWGGCREGVYRHLHWPSGGKRPEQPSPSPPPPSKDQASQSLLQVETQTCRCFPVPGAT